MITSPHHTSFSVSQYWPLLVLFLLFCQPLWQNKAIAAGYIYSGCFPASTHYSGSINAELSPSDNAAGHTITGQFNHELPGDAVVAQCSTCTGVSANTNEVISSYAATSLPAGAASGFGKLTDKISIKVSYFSDTMTGGNIQKSIQNYPTEFPTVSISEPVDGDENTQSLCAKSPVAGVPQRQFKWNKTAASLYIVSPILGEEVIPLTTILRTYVCIASTNIECPFEKAAFASDISLSGIISAPLGCVINQGSKIDVEFGTLASSNFTAQGHPPSGYTLRDVDIQFHCDKPAVSNSDKIRLSFSSDQGVSDTGTGFIAKMIGRDDIGVRMYDADNQNVTLDGTTELPITLDDNGDGRIKMTAAPVATTGSKPAPGKFEGNVTVKMNIR